MKLKAIELKGFKSFADRTRIEFLDGVTCVVGPNGCGKSNITDAIRWVLGEQSSGSLRASKMEDVIFNGTEHRPPLHFAEVSLLFDEAEEVLETGARELSIKRILHRSGDSSYYINGSLVRLKDVKELLMDTGIGISGYSLISQGDIEDILKDSKFNRRKIFEEASGISLFDFKKREAERKLYRVEENLTRLRDIFQELDQRMGPLEEASDKAKRYQELKEQYKAINIHFLLLDYDNHHGKLSELESSIGELSKKLDSYTLEEEDIRHRRGESQEKLSKNREQEGALQALLQEKRQVREEILIDVKLTEQRLLQKREEQPKLDEDIKGLEIKLEDTKKITEELNEQVLQSEKERDQAQLELSDYHEKLQRLRSLLERSDVEHQDHNQKKHELEASLAQAKENHRFLSEQLEREKAHHQSMIEDKREVKIQRRSLEDQLMEKEVELQELSELLSSLTEKKKGFEEQASFIQREVEVLKKDLHQDQLEQGRLETELQLLDSFSEETKGRSEENLSLLDPSLKQRHVGHLLDKISPKKGYERAVESVLETYRSTLIFSGERDHLSRFETLFKHPQRIYFNEHKSREYQLKDGHRPLTSILTYKRTDEAWIEALFGHIAFAESYTGEELSYELVTREGTLIKQDGTVWIAPADHKGTTYRDRRELFEKLRNVEQRVLDMEESLITAEENLLLVKDHLQETQAEEQEKQGESHHLREALQQAKEQLALISYKERQLVESNERLTSTLSSHQDRLDQLSEKISDETKQLEDLLKMKASEVPEDSKTHFNELLEAQTEKRIEVTKLEESYYHKLKNLQFQRHALEDAKAQREQLEKSRKDLLEKLEELQRDLDEKREVQGQIQQDMAEISEHLRLIQEESLKYQDSLIQLENRRDELLRMISEAKEEHQSLEIHEVRLQEKVQNITTELWSQYELSVFAAKQKWDPKGSFQRKQLKELSLEMLSLEPVNLGAIEEFSELKERYTFLSEQMSDLERSKKDIEKSIKSLEKKMLASFKSTFQDIKVHFKQVFSDLFQGGTGDIQLVDEENVLESDILILASPPGKKLTHMNLLSGGEKALTAIALLFSVLRAKPAPFYVLDEIEAALDDYNISRFGHFLEEFSKGSQFIIITHRKGTMQYAKALYGVSMEEKGVSNMVSLQIKEQDHA